MSNRTTGRKDPFSYVAPDNKEAQAKTESATTKSEPSPAPAKQQTDSAKPQAPKSKERQLKLPKTLESVDVNLSYFGSFE